MRQDRLFCLGVRRVGRKDARKRLLQVASYNVEQVDVLQSFINAYLSTEVFDHLFGKVLVTGAEQEIVIPFKWLDFHLLPHIIIKREPPILQNLPPHVDSSWKNSQLMPRLHTAKTKSEHIVDTTERNIVSFFTMDGEVIIDQEVIRTPVIIHISVNSQQHIRQGNQICLQVIS